MLMNLTAALFFIFHIIASKVLNKILLPHLYCFCCWGVGLMSSSTTNWFASLILILSLTPLLTPTVSAYDPLN